MREREQRRRRGNKAGIHGDASWKLLRGLRRKEGWEIRFPIGLKHNRGVLLKQGVVGEKGRAYVGFLSARWDPNQR